MNDLGHNEARHIAAKIDGLSLEIGRRCTTDIENVTERIREKDRIATNARLVLLDWLLGKQPDIGPQP